MAVARPVARRGAGHEALHDPFPRVIQHRQIVEAHAGAQSGAAADFEQMPGQTETGDIGHGVHAGQLRELQSGRVELRGHGQHLPIAFGGQLSLLQRRGKNAHAQGLAENQGVTRLRTAVALDLVRMHDAQGHQTIDGFQRVDGMAARDRNARRRAHGLAAGQNALDDIDRQFIERHADHGEREYRLRAHGVDIRNGIGRRDAPEVVWIVDYGCKKIRGGNDGLVVVQAIHRRVVAGLDADQ